MEGRCLWIQADDVDGPLDEGHVVKATRTLNDWCLRGDDGGEPVEAGALLEIVEVRAWGTAMAQEVPALHVELRQAADELVAEGLWEWAS